MAVNTVVRALSVCIALLLVLAATHKVRVLLAGEAHAQPLIRLGGWRKRHVSGAMTLAAIGELALVIALLAAPLVGFAGASLLLTFYAREVRRLPPGQPCNCFGAVLHTRAGAGASRRNVLLGVASATAFLGYATGAVEVVPLSEATLGIALLLMAALTAAEALRRIGEPTRGASAIGG